MILKLRTLAAAALVVAAPAQAQTVEDAGKFFDQVVSNGGTGIYRARTDTYENGYHAVPYQSTTANCVSTIRGNTFLNASAYSSTPNYDVEINWSNVVEIRHFYDDAAKPGLLLAGGARTKMWGPTTYVYSGGSGPAVALFIETNSLSMDERLTKAINVLIKGCAKGSYGF